MRNNILDYTFIEICFAWLKSIRNYFDRMITTILGVEYFKGNHVIKSCIGHNKPIHFYRYC
jgi:hypothetical protein